MRNTLKTTVLLAALGGLMVLVGSMFGTSGAVIGLGLGLAFVGGSYWFSATIAIRAARALRSPRPRCRSTSPSCATWRAAPACRCPGCTSSPGPAQRLRHRAQPEERRRAVTEGILQHADVGRAAGRAGPRDQPRSNRDILIASVAAAVAMGITFIARMVMWGAIFGGGGGDRDRDGGIFGLLAMASSPPSPRRCSRWRFAAAASTRPTVRCRPLGDGEPLARPSRRSRPPPAGADGVDPAQAQAYIVNPLRAGEMQFASLFRTHPPTEDRVARLRAGAWR